MKIPEQRIFKSVYKRRKEKHLRIKREMVRRKYIYKVLTTYENAHVWSISRNEITLNKQSLLIN